MSGAASLLSPIAKESRALAFPWLACFVAMILPALFDSPRELVGISVPAYFIAMAALGALSIGHEYTGRTVSLLLSMPASRQRLLAIKLFVLAMMLLALWAVADTVVFSDSRLPQNIRQTATWVPLFGGLFLAPWLTMVCRSAIGGAVFTFGIEGALYTIGELVGTRLYGDGLVMAAFRLAFVWYGTLVLCIVGGIAMWPVFARLEALDGPGQHVQLPHWLRGSDAAGSQTTALRRRHPVWMLVQKELHLQQLPLALALVFAITWPLARWATARATSPGYESLLDACVFLYAGLLPMVISACASAGERQIGLLEWQMLQPVTTLKQWAVKAGVVVGLALTLALLVPMILLQVADLTTIGRPALFVRRDQMLIVALMLLTSGSLYVSTLCSSTLWALVMSIPAAMASAAFFQFAWGRIASPTHRLARRWAMELLQPQLIGTIDAMRFLNWLTLVLIAGFIALTLRVAFTNHRSADRASVRLWRQPAILAAFVVAAAIVHGMATGVIVANNLLQLPPQYRTR